MTTRNILIVEDDRDLRDAIVETISLAGYEVNSADCGSAALELIAKKKPALIISDVQMPGVDGHQLLTRIHNDCPEVPVILMTAHGKISDAVSAIQHGAADYIAKPFDPESLNEKISRFIPAERSNEPVAQDAKSQQLFSLAFRVAQTEATVLISGESGTGKEVLAHYIHDHSPRAHGPFVAINCAAIPENMLEATLFGFEKGAFTGALKTTPGKFEQAQNGTLLLDEISEMDLALQAKLLRVLQEKEVERIGSREIIKLNVRVLATTNRDMQAEVLKNRFREDLFYRLNVFPLHWLPLRDRRDDILPMANYLIQKHARDSKQVIPKLTTEAQQKLFDYNWPGNAREMDNVIQRALIMQSGDYIEENDLLLTKITTLPREVSEESPNGSLSGDMRVLESKKILDALNEHGGRRNVVAKALGISERTLRYKIAKMRESGVTV